jgi:hypothetical protein
MNFFKTVIAILLLMFLVKLVSAQEVELKPDSEMMKRAFKVEFFSPLTGNLTVGYEQYLKNWVGIEAKVGIIGLGKQNYTYEKDKGFFVKLGPKFKLKPSFAQKGTFGTDYLSGGYFRPEIHFSTFEHYPAENGGVSEQVYCGVLMLNYGKQYVLGNAITLDWYFGLGYAYSSHDGPGYHYSFAHLGNDTPLAFNLGLTLGVLSK